MLHAHEIIPGLWIGNHVASSTQDFYIENSISCVINCTKELDFLQTTEKKGIKNIRIPVDDDLTENQIESLYLYLWDITEYIHKELLQYKNILVHCYAGVQRSSTIVCAYMMRYGKLPYKKVVAMIRSKRPICFRPSINFKKSLIKFENKLQFLEDNNE
tara:strand:- start:188 stop:664 length:477 start_codon:yes stop_codon:yes gene_type:complete